jgi:hypothetical protein
MSENKLLKWLGDTGNSVILEVQILRTSDLFLEVILLRTRKFC